MSQAAASDALDTDVLDRHGIGGNAAPDLKERLPQDYGHLVEEVEALAERANGAPAEVRNDIDHGIIANIVKDATRINKRLEAVRVDETAPYLAGQREVMGFFKPHIERIERLAKLIGDRGEVYLKRKRAEEQRLRDEEERKRREAARLAHEEAQRKIREAAEAQRRADEAARLAREEEDRRLREAARLKREEEDRVARAAAAAEREAADRAQREADQASRQKNAAMEKIARERREREELEAAEAARVRAETERAAAEAAAKADADRVAAAAESARKMDEAKAALAEADEAEQARQEAERLANAAPADMSRTRADGSLSSLRRSYDFEVDDWDALDLEALRPYLTRPALEIAIRAFVKTHRETKQIRGVRIFATTKAQYR